MEYLRKIITLGVSGKYSKIKDNDKIPTVKIELRNSNQLYNDERNRSKDYKNARQTIYMHSTICSMFVKFGYKQIIYIKQKRWHIQ